MADLDQLYAHLKAVITEAQECYQKMADCQQLLPPAVRICKTGEKHTSGAWDAASATQVECCALHPTRVPYLLDGELAVLRRRGGGNLVDIRTDCI